MNDPRDSMVETTTSNGERQWRGRIPLAHLVTNHRAMVETLTAGRTTQSAGEPVELCLREDTPGRFEVVDGHHRLAEVIRAHDVTVDAVIYDYADDEPYQGPYYRFPTTEDRAQAKGAHP